MVAIRPEIFNRYKVLPFEGVTVYGRHKARDFQQVQSFFEDRGVIFDHTDIDRDQGGLERMVTLSGQQEAVVIEIGKKILVGFNPDQLEAVLP
jgi:hypothetical protein